MGVNPCVSVRIRAYPFAYAVRTFVCTRAYSCVSMRVFVRILPVLAAYLCVLCVIRAYPRIRCVLMRIRAYSPRICAYPLAYLCVSVRVFARIRRVFAAY